MCSNAQMKNFTINTAESMSGVLWHGAFMSHYDECWRCAHGMSRESKKGRKVDALAHRGDEGRDKLR